MYVHDALYTHRGVQADEPITIDTPRGYNIVLPKSASNPERERVARLLDRFFNYVRAENVFVQHFVAAAEEISNMTAEDVEHTVLMLQGRRPAAVVRAENAAHAAQSPFASAAGHHGRFYGMPEVCVLCPRQLAEKERYKVIVNLRSGGLEDLSIDNRAFDALYHVLLHPYGHVGWEVGLLLRTKAAAFSTIPPEDRTGNGPAGSSGYNPRSTLSMLDYYAHRLHYRRGLDLTENCLFMAERLFQEYLCVAFWRIESGRLNIHRMQQAEKRAARGEELRWFVEQRMAGNLDADVGRVSYIPESFIGGPTDMYAKYQDAMCSVLYHGAPSAFVTFTANPEWTEVKESLAHGQSAKERPDVIVRVFEAKLRQLLEDLKDMFGRQVCRIHVIEFQKRGLPHAHIVVILAAADRPRTAAHIDKMTTAELPPAPAEDDVSPEAVVRRRLRELVLKHMVHNDCSGEKGRTCPCWNAAKQRCSGNFPFDFCPSTTVGDEHSKSAYRRRQGAAWTHVDSAGRRITNQWVVPYNAALLLKYECHINFEVVTAEHAIKYLFKYCFKGADSASAAIKATERVADKIGKYQDHRYLGSAEAAWRLFKFWMAENTDTVIRMSLKLPEEQYANRSEITRMII